jgi:hypothetical protein
MPLLSRVCNHPDCTRLVIAQDSCYMHNGKNVVHNKKKKSSIDANERIISKSKDGTKERVYRQCSHTECKNIAKKFGVCYIHGAPRSRGTCKVLLSSERGADVNKVEENEFAVYLNALEMDDILISGVEDEKKYWERFLRELMNAHPIH